MSQIIPGPLFVIKTIPYTFGNESVTFFSFTRAYLHLPHPPCQKKKKKEKFE